jgi:hypothetical protein
VTTDVDIVEIDVRFSKDVISQKSKGNSISQTNLNNNDKNNKKIYLSGIYEM